MTSTSSTTVPSMPTNDVADASTSGDDGGVSGVVDRVTTEVPAQAAQVVGDVKAQLSDATQRSLADLRTQADDRTAQAAQGLRGLSTQVDALVSGRPDEAGNLTGVAQTIGQHATDLAERLDADGLQGVADDVSRFGRQHPMAFLGLALGAGFLVGRLVRTTATVAGEGKITTSLETQPDTAALNGAPAMALGASEGTGAQGPGVER